MADVAQVAEQSSEFKHKVFGGSSRNMVPGIALVGAGLLAPAMGLTDVYFAAALAWVFVIWGLFFIFVALIDVYESWDLSDEALTIRSPMRFWQSSKSWPWSDIFRVDIELSRRDIELGDAEMRVYYTPSDDSNIEREDRDYNPDLLRLIVERAGLKPQDGAPTDLHHLPQGINATYTWQ